MTAQQQLAEMGIIQLYLPLHGVYTYINNEQFQIYQNQLKEKILADKSN